VTRTLTKIATTTAATKAVTEGAAALTIIIVKSIIQKL